MIVPGGCFMPFWTAVVPACSSSCPTFSSASWETFGAAVWDTGNAGVVWDGNYEYALIEIGSTFGSSICQGVATVNLTVTLLALNSRSGLNGTNGYLYHSADPDSGYPSSGVTVFTDSYTAGEHIFNVSVPSFEINGSNYVYLKLDALVQGEPWGGLEYPGDWVIKNVTCSIVPE